MMQRSSTRFSGWKLPCSHQQRKSSAGTKYKKSGGDCDKIIYHNTKHRFRDLDSEDGTSSRLLKNNKGEDLNIPEGEALAGMFSGDDERRNQHHNSGTHQLHSSTSTPKLSQSSEKRWMLLQAQQKFQVLENLHICRTSSLALKNLSVYDLRVPSEYLALYRRVGGESLVSLLMKMLRFQFRHTLCQEIQTRCRI
jgi:hypothetical protein